MRQFRFIERKVDCHGTVIGDRIGKAIIKIVQSPREVRSKQIGALRIAGLIKVGLHEDPIQFEFGDAYLPPDQFGNKSWSESFASPLVGVA